MAEKRDRNNAIWVDREKGMTFGQLSIKYGLSKRRVIDICMREKEISGWLKEDGALFVAALRECGCSESSITRIVRALSSEEISIDALSNISDFTLLSIPCIGKGSLNFIRTANEICKKRS